MKLWPRAHCVPSPWAQQGDSEPAGPPVPKPARLTVPQGGLSRQPVVRPVGGVPVPHGCRKVTSLRSPTLVAQSSLTPAGSACGGVGEASGLLGAAHAVGRERQRLPAPSTAFPALWGPPPSGAWPCPTSPGLRKGPRSWGQWAWHGLTSLGGWEPGPLLPVALQAWQLWPVPSLSEAADCPSLKRPRVPRPALQAAEELRGAPG